MFSHHHTLVEFFSHPTVLTLPNQQARLLLLWLILFADEKGQEVAHAGLLGLAMDESAETMETALQALVTHDALVLVQCEKRRMYQLTHWHTWQHLRSQRLPAPSSLVAESKIDLSDLSYSTSSPSAWA